MKIVYDEKTTELIESLQGAIDFHIKNLTGEKQTTAGLILGDRDVLKRLENDHYYRRLNEELVRIHSIAIPVRYEF